MVMISRNYNYLSIVIKTRRETLNTLAFIKPAMEACRTLRVCIHSPVATSPATKVHFILIMPRSVASMKRGSKGEVFHYVLNFHENFM